MDTIKKNELKAKLYKDFYQKVETDIIDMVLEGCNYNGK